MSDILNDQTNDKYILMPVSSVSFYLDGSSNN